MTMCFPKDSYMYTQLRGFWRMDLSPLKASPPLNLLKFQLSEWDCGDVSQRRGDPTAHQETNHPP